MTGTTGSNGPILTVVGSESNNDLADITTLRFQAPTGGSGFFIVDSNAAVSIWPSSGLDDPVVPGSAPALSITGDGTNLALQVDRGPVAFTEFTTPTTGPTGAGGATGYAGITGQIAIDTDFIYVCTSAGATGSALWKRAQLL